MEKGASSYDGIEFEDSDSIPSQNTGGFKQIALDQFRKCCIEGSKEMTFGGVMQRFIQGTAVEITVPNQVQIFINSVEILRTLLEPKIRTSRTGIKKMVDEIYERLKGNLKEKNDNKRLITNDFSGKTKNFRQHYTSSFTELIIHEDRQFEALQIFEYRKLLEQLSLLLDELRYFDESSAMF